MLHIIDVRRERVLAAAEFPKGLQNTFNHMERAGNPCGMPADERVAWTKGLPFPGADVGRKARSRRALLGRLCGGFRSAGAKDRSQYGDDIQCRRAGLGGARQRREMHRRHSAAHRQRIFIRANGRRKYRACLNEIKAKTIVTTCPHCFHTIANEYPQFGGNYAVKHHTEFIDELVRSGKVKLSADGAGSVTYHDPCYSGGITVSSISRAA